MATDPKFCFFVFQCNASAPVQADPTMDRRREKGRWIYSFAPGMGAFFNDVTKSPTSLQVLILIFSFMPFLAALSLIF